ncbi:hypothetical protein XAPC_2618 [Xanthomonas citri pv. punicae str. LMG 859]|nr:hypothetical protein XAPC_2618 [Xanthomonas citri pv. punicae str. LMG 859]
MARRQGRRRHSATAHHRHPGSAQAHHLHLRARCAVAANRRPFNSNQTDSCSIPLPA